MFRNVPLMLSLTVFLAASSEAPLRAAADPDAVGTVTLGATGVKAAPNTNVITVSGTNAVHAAKAAQGWVVAANNPVTVFAVGQTTGYTTLFAVTLALGNDTWTAESAAVANETYDVWAVTTFTKPAAQGQPADSQNVGSEFKSQVVNRNQNPIVWVIGATGTYTQDYPKRSGAGAFIEGKGKYTVAAGFKLDAGLPFLFVTIPVDGGVVRYLSSSNNGGVTAGNGNWSTIALSVPSTLKYNTYFTNAVTVDPPNSPPPGAVPHIINAVAKNR
jgi:hypothetical protein